MLDCVFHINCVTNVHVYLPILSYLSYKCPSVYVLLLSYVAACPDHYILVSVRPSVRMENRLPLGGFVQFCITNFY